VVAVPTHTLSYCWALGNRATRAWYACKLYHIRRVFVTCTCSALRNDSPPPAQTLAHQHLGLHDPDVAVAVAVLRHADHDCLKLAKDSTPIDYPKPDGVTTFDLPTSLYRSGRKSGTRVVFVHWHTTGWRSVGGMQAAAPVAIWMPRQLLTDFTMHLGNVAHCASDVVPQHSVTPSLVLCMATYLSVLPSHHGSNCCPAAAFCRRHQS